MATMRTEDAIRTEAAVRAEAAVAEFSLVRGDAAFRFQRALGLIPSRSLGVGRRAVLFAFLAWTPIVVAAAIAHRVWPGEAEEPLLQHFGIHVRFLVAVPLMILGEAVAEMIGRRILTHLVHSGIVTDADQPRFVALVQRVVALRNGWLPWTVIVGLVAASTLFRGLGQWGDHELRWAVTTSPSAALDFAVFWFRYVARPIFFALLLMWLWRLVLVTALMHGIARLDLALVPTHPDRVAGLGVVVFLPMAFAPAALGFVAVLAGHWTHDARFHGTPVQAYTWPVAALAIVITAALLLPLLVFIRPLSEARRRGLLDYGALVGEHHRLVRRRWVLRQALRDDALIEAPELGPVADTISLYDAIVRMRPAPIPNRLLIVIALLIALPMLPLLTVEVPLRDALLKILKTVM
jgi:hypothetical protein